ncbi:hypothetical protein CDL15_Pgr002946 [Punica granatum]|uniref:Auxin-responsive protein SAUR71-like n=1 Tax=Punica granatum TaxID=22663 RepID=A0A218X0R8_PUNGR|nr:hypothetical protein CDL15_Pgr002946 [Punica granatum]PKI31346.1 hypothetical protein CRG98_048272 [Punica granatum]
MGKFGRTYNSPLAYQKINSQTRARRGFVPMLVGRDSDAMERLHVPTKLVEHPYIAALLDMSADDFGYGQDGLIRIRFDADCFKQMVKRISKEKR